MGPKNEQELNEFMEFMMQQEKAGSGGKKSREEMEMFAMMADLMGGPSDFPKKPSKAKAKKSA